MSSPVDVESETPQAAKAILSPSNIECPENEKYSVFTQAEKWSIVAIISAAAFSSNIGSFIYYPALKLLSETFQVSISQINLTVTAYMAVATVAPTLSGDAADVLGRRPMYLVTLSLFVTANICLALAKSYGELLGVIAIGYGVVTDIASPAERGSFVSAVSFSTTIAPSLGPILGGVLSYKAGWSWIFGFLTIVSALSLLLIVCFLPETSRAIVGNGSIQPAHHLRPICPFMRHWNSNIALPKPQKARMPNPLNSLKIILRKDNAIVLLAWGLMYAVYACVITSLSTLCIELYGLNEWQAGLIYLPFGLGGTVATFFSGKLLDSAYKNARTKKGLSTDRVRGDDLNEFPIERARLSVMWIPMSVIALCIVAYGWVLQYGQHISIPLTLLFIIGLALQINFSAFNTLIVDINHQYPSAVNASTSLVRCSLAAIAVAFLDDMIQTLGIGWTFTIIGGLCLVVLCLFSVEFYKGMSWRQEATGIETST